MPEGRFCEQTRWDRDKRRAGRDGRAAPRLRTQGFKSRRRQGVGDAGSGALMTLPAPHCNTRRNGPVRRLHVPLGSVSKGLSSSKVTKTGGRSGAVADLIFQSVRMTMSFLSSLRREKVHLSRERVASGDAEEEGAESASGHGPVMHDAAFVSLIAVGWHWETAGEEITHLDASVAHRSAW